MVGLLALAAVSASQGVGEGFALPACETPGSWAPALALAGFAAGAGPVSLDGCGHPWVLTVADDAGAVHRVAVAAARTSDEREDLALLARSLRQGSRAPAIAEPKAAVESAVTIAPVAITRAVPKPIAARSHPPTRQSVALVSEIAPEATPEIAPEPAPEIAKADAAPDPFRAFSHLTDSDDEPLPLALPMIIPTWDASPRAPRAEPALAAQLADAQRAAAEAKLRDDATDAARSERFQAEKEQAEQLRAQHRIDRQVESVRDETRPAKIETPFDSWGSAGIGLAAASDRGAGPMAELAGGARQRDLLLGGSFTATMPTTLLGFGDGRTTNAVSGLAMVGLEPVSFGSVAVGMGGARRWFAEDGESAGGVWIPQVGASLEARSTLHRTLDLRARIGGRYDLQRVRFESGDASLGTMSPFELTLGIGVGQ
jgi:hypothetical protein